MKVKKGKEQEYKDWYDNNPDPYGHAIFTYSERWAELMEEVIEASDDDPANIIASNAESLSHKADIEGITGYMYGAAVTILSKEWEYGDILRKWHNKKIQL